MKKFISIILAVLMTLSLCACTGSGETAKEPEATFRVGYAREDITPSDGVPLGGYGDTLKRISTGYLDYLFATCIAVTDAQDNTVLLFSQDLIASTYYKEVRSNVSQATGIAEDNIMLCATHTHSGPDQKQSHSGITSWKTTYLAAVVKAAQAALEDRSAAEISIGRTQAEGLNFVRHYLQEGGTYVGDNFGSESAGKIIAHAEENDPEMQVIKFTRAAEDKKDIIIASFPAHATTVNSTNRTSLSACYPGAFRAAVERDAGVHCAFFQGASGDQVPNSKIEEKNAINPKNHKNHGEKLAEYALSVELTPMEDSKLVFKSWEYTGPSMKEGLDDAELMAHASEIASLSNKLGSSHIDVQALVSKYGFLTVYEATGLVSRSKAPETRTMRLVAMQLGSEVSMAFAPYEMFGMHGKYIKDNSPFAMDFIVTCTEDYQGYFPHVEGCEEGFYEYDVTKYERGTGEKLAELFASTLTEMKNAG